MINLDLPWVDLHTDLIDFISNHNSNDLCSELIMVKDEEKFPKIYIDSFLKKHIDYLNSELSEDFKIPNLDYKICEVPTIWMKDTFQFESFTNHHSCEGFLYHCIESKNKDFIFAFIRIPKLRRVYFSMYAKNIHGNWRLVSLGFPEDNEW